ncbi:MAG TPA: hypothetical protein VJ550_06170 [Geomonas sp.]|nr:hypothetical protein [Geomonas sp.]
MKKKGRLIGLFLFSMLGLTGLAQGAQPQAEGDQHTFVIGHHGISMVVPAGWTARLGGFGVDLTVIGPKSRDAQAVVTLSHIGETENLRFDEPKTEEKKYRSERSEWLKMRDGKFLSLIPYRKLSFRDVTGYSIGYRYSTWGKNYVENSSILYCKGSVYQLQSQSAGADERGTAKAFEKMISGFACQ